MVQKTFLMEKMVPNHKFYVFLNTRTKNKIKVYPKMRTLILHKEQKLNWSFLKEGLGLHKKLTLIWTRMTMALHNVESTVLFKNQSTSPFSPDEEAG